MNSDEIKIIDICSETHDFVDQIKQCDKILSSSLHGVIASDAYGIPNLWIKMSNKVGGGSFKFEDYFLSVNRKYDCFEIDNNSSLEEVIRRIPDFDINIDLDVLYQSCPFRS